MPSEAKSAPDYAKFKQLVLLLATLSQNDPRFGSTKLNKLLYYCDFESYRLLGVPMTGIRYQRQPQGPVAADLKSIQETMRGDDQIRFKRRARGAHEQHVIEAVHIPRSAETFTADELAIIHAAIRDLEELDASGASNWSHEHSVGWRVVKNGDEIPYVSALFDKRKLSERGVERVRRRLQAEKKSA